MTVSWNENQAIRQVRLCGSLLKRSRNDEYVAISRKMSSGNTVLRATTPLDGRGKLQRASQTLHEGARHVNLYVGCVGDCQSRSFCENCHGPLVPLEHDPLCPPSK